MSKKGELSGIGRNAKKKFMRHLGSLEQVFNFLSGKYDIKDRMHSWQITIRI